MKDLSILIPARNEQFLARTVKDILEHIEADTEILVALDGAWPEEPLEIHPRVKVIYFPQSIGQRAATNQLARLSDAKYLMKVDAHCAFDQGFDRKMIDAFNKSGDNVVMVPVMRNLHIFNWVCDDCHLTEYQGPTHPCPQCGGVMRKDIVWIPKTNPQSVSYCFDAEPHFQYFNEWKKTQNYKQQLETGLTETMSLQGSCFMCTRDKYWEYGLDNEQFGSWGSQGIQVACSFWFNSGRVLVNHATWYAHLFRTSGGDFGFPYELSGKQVSHAKKTAKNLYFNDKLIALLEKFWPVKGWTEEDLKRLKNDQPTTKKPTKGVVYYTDNRPDEPLFSAVQQQILKGIKEKHVVSVSLQPLNFGKNIHFKGERGILTMFRQILAGLEASTAEVIFFCEHDVLYHPSHFDFVPPEKDKFYYNTNFWRVRQSDSHAYRTDETKVVSGLCAYRELLVEHYRKRVARLLRNQADSIENGQPVKNDGYLASMGYEPGTHSHPRGIDNHGCESYQSKYPNLDIRHNKNLTPSRWSPEEFRDQRYTKGWQEATEVDGWGSLIKLDEMLYSLIK